MSPTPVDILISEPELMAKLNCRRRGDLRRVLLKAGVPVMIGVGGTVVTTLGAINQALGVVRGEPDGTQYGELEVL